MIYDKIASHVGYNDKAHTYTNMNTGAKYTSVTTLIHKFVPEFKSDYWATYKALKDIMEAAGSWYSFKKAAGGWEGAVEYWHKKAIHHPADLRQDIDVARRDYLEKWRLEKNDACEKGSAIHNELEAASYHAQEIKDEDTIYRVSQDDILNTQNFDSNGAYPELLIYSDRFMVSGQADKVFKSGKYVDIHDYKTCKKIDTEGFRGETLLAPLGHLQNANYWIYSLQLSMYGYMLAECGYKVRNLYMHWIHGKDEFDKERNAGVKTFKLPYLEEDVERILLTNTN